MPNCSSTLSESGSRSVMVSTLRLMIRAASFWSSGTMIGPMPQPYICTRAPHRLAAQSV